MSFADPNDLHTAFAAAFRGRDVEALVDLYENGAIQVQQDGTVVDHDHLAGVFTALLAAGVTMQGEAQPAIVAGDLALTSTRYTFDPDGPGATRTVVTAEVSRRQADGSWRVVVDAPAFA